MPIDVSELREQKRPGGGTWYFRKSDDTQVCGSRRAKRPPDSRCAQHAALDEYTGRCYVHGGAQGSGQHLTNPRKAGPKTLQRWKDTLERVIQEDRVDNLKDGLVVLRAQMELASEKVDELDTPDFRMRLKELVDEMYEAATEGRQTDFLGHMTDLRALIERGCEEVEAMRNAGRAATRYLQRGERYWAVKLAKRQSMAAEDVRAMLRRLFGEVSIALEPSRIRDVKPELLGPKTLEHLEGVLQSEVG